MSINFQNNLSPIKILILDLFPSFSELNQTDDEIFIIFEGLNIFYDLKDLLTLNKKIELENKNQSSIIVSLVKSNNIIASGSINLKYGEQWVTLNSEAKKKSSMNLALSLIDCIKLKIFCEIKNINKNGINNTISNINHSLNLTNINNSINLTNRNMNKNKQQNNHINLKISNKNINNKTLIKGSPNKVNSDIYGTKRSPKGNKYSYSNQKFASNDINNNIPIKNFNSNFDSINHQNSIKKNNNPYSTINKQNIKKIDLNSKTRNSKIERKSPISSNYASLRTSNNFGIKKINTSIFNLHLKNQNKKSRMAPDIEIKELHNSKNLGGSPKLYHKNKLDDDTFQNSGNKTFHYGKKNIKKINLQKNQTNNINNIDNKKNKKKQKKNSYSNNILNINYENNNNIINMNIVNNINNNQYKNINDNNFANFNSTYGNNFNKQDIKSKLLYPAKTNPLFKNQPINYLIDRNLNINKKTEFERSLNSFEDVEEKIMNKTKENIKIPEKMNIYTNKRANIKKNKPQIIKKYDEKNINSENIIIQKPEENSDFKEANEINENIAFLNKQKRKDNNDKLESNHKDNENIENSENSEINNNENENFERIKEDFLLLYNDNYMNNIQDDLLKLEIELFIEKMTELIQYYHNEYNNKIFEKEIIQNNYKINCGKYKDLHKLIKKLEINQIDYEMKNFNKKNKQNNNHINTNKTEIKMLKVIFNDKKYNDNKNMLKNILNKIFGNKNNNSLKDLLTNEQINLFMNNIKDVKNFNNDNAYRKKIINFSNS